MRATDKQVKFKIQTKDGPMACEGTIVELDAAPDQVWVAHHKLVQKRNKLTFECRAWVVSHYATGACIDETAARGSMDAAMATANRIIRNQPNGAESIQRAIEKHPILNPEAPAVL